MTEKRYKPNVENTAARDPFLNLAEGMMYVLEGKDPSQAIEDMERRGTQQLAANSSLLPAIGTIRGRYDGTNHRAVWEKMGIVFGDVKEGDDLFVHVTLPDGWSIKTTDHNMWNKLIDDKGRERASIFYKAAYYDRSAHIHPTRRYTVETDYQDVKGNVIREVVKDGANVIFATEWVTRPTNATREELAAYFDLLDARREIAITWLNEHFPLHTDVNAYWDE